MTHWVPTVLLKAFQQCTTEAGSDHVATASMAMARIPNQKLEDQERLLKEESSVCHSLK